MAIKSTYWQCQLRPTKKLLVSITIPALHACAASSPFRTSQPYHDVAVSLPTSPDSHPRSLIMQVEAQKKIKKK